jgi:hypothetical protein
LLLSSTRNEAFISPPIDMPVIFVHHERDACEHTFYSTDKNRYERVASFNKSPTIFITVTTGNAGGGDACHSGFHMLFNADVEVSKKLDDSLSKVLIPNHSGRLR